MQSKATTVKQYLSTLPDDRRSAIETVRAVILENLDDDFEEVMQYGMIGYAVPHRIYPAGYHCDPKQPLPFAGLASQKNYMSLYLMCHYSVEYYKWFQAAWTKAGKKLDMGKCCVRFKRIDDVALDVLAEAIARVPAKAFIEYYEAAVKSSDKSRSKPAGNRSKTSNAAKSKGRTQASRKAVRPQKSRWRG